jgi:hypothetical protein
MEPDGPNDGFISELNFGLMSTDSIYD